MTFYSLGSIALFVLAAMPLFGQTKMRLVIDDNAGKVATIDVLDGNTLGCTGECANLVTTSTGTHGTLTVQTSGGQFGQFTFTITAEGGVSSSAPQLQRLVVTATATTGPGRLTLTFTDTDYGLAGGGAAFPGAFTLVETSTSSSSTAVDYQSFVGLNTIPASNLVGQFLNVLGTASTVSNTFSNPLPGSLTASLTSRINVEFSGAGNFQSTFTTSLRAPSITKSFSPQTIPVGGISRLTFVLLNPNSSNPLNNVSFTDTLPAGLVVASTPALSNSCGGAATATPGSGSITLANGTLPGNVTCTVAVTVTGITAGVKENSVQVFAGALAGITARDTLTVTALPPSISKAFAVPSIPINGTTSLTLTISNANAVALTGVAFTDVLPAGLVVATPSALNNTCGGAATTGSGSISLVNGTVAGTGSCTVTVNVTGTTTGTKDNSVQVLSSIGAGNTATASLTVIAPPVLSKSFGAPAVDFSGTVPLTFQVSNTNTAAPLNGISFTDTLPAGLIVSTPNGLTGSCGGGAVSAIPGGTSISLTGATLAAGASCTFTVNVTGIIAGPQTNVTSVITSTNGGTGPPATASVEVRIPGDAFQVSYSANLNIGDSVINITNTGARGAGLAAGTTASVTGAICVNAYAFSPDEQVIACCSCPVTPNGLVSLSAKQDLISNTLTPAVPTSIVIKLLATIPIGGTCTSSASMATVTGLTQGLAAWGTTLHATPAAGMFRGTETRFIPATLSPGELDRITTACTFINALGSGFGICRSCRLGGLGADRR